MKDKNILYEYLSKIIIPLFFNIDKYHYNITFLDILYYMKNKIMFTGTPDIVLPKDVVSLLPNPYSIVFQLMLQLNLCFKD